MESKKKDTNVFTNRNRLTDTDGWLPEGKLGRDKSGAGINRDTLLLKGASTLETHTFPNVKGTASGNLLYDAAAQIRALG